MPILMPLTEPANPRYIYINPVTNKVHLLVPIVGGEEISRDNTCKVMVELREFFNDGALSELKKYKSALALDISGLGVGDPRRIAKEERLSQIEAYIEAVSAMKMSYSEAIHAFQARPSNLYSIQLRPSFQDSQSSVINPVFNVERKNEGVWTPLSALYNAIHSLYPAVTIAVPDARTRLKATVEAALSPSPTFEEVQSALTAQCLSLFGLHVDFTRQTNGTEASKALIEEMMGLSIEPTADGQSPVLPTPEQYKAGYIDGLLGACAPDIWDSIPAPIFYSIPAETPNEERRERLSMMTQFFLANLNVYCKSHGISSLNFGAILDASNDLSRELVTTVTTALAASDDVEEKIGAFFNGKTATFGLTHPLSTEEIQAVKQQFERTYKTITATLENPHMDDFMILDREARGEIAKCVTHQNAICVNFAEIIDPTAASANPAYFESIRADFTEHPTEIPHKNESVAGGEVEVPIEHLLGLSEEQFERLPTSAKDACRAHPAFQARLFLNYVAKATPDKTDPTLIKTEAEALLKAATPADRQALLRTPGKFTDYSGRTFNCTAFEYAYWAKDIHMCKMLLSYMDDETKAELLTRINVIEGIDTAPGQLAGLCYQQGGISHRSPHFDLTPLKTALEGYIDGLDAWKAASNLDAIDTAWLAVGKAQRELPVHVLNEYCRQDRSFYPTPLFNDGAPPRALKFFNYVIYMARLLFPLSASNSGLGFDFALLRAQQGAAAGVPLRGGALASGGPPIDLNAIKRLDEVSTAALTRLQEDLNPPASTALAGMVI